MSKLNYKTRDNLDPKGKPRVYFCCHPDDFDKCFESVSDEILAKQSCAIWYIDETIVRDENFLVDLKHMQLFVMPVTTKLLCTENEALDIEFKFAIENHIPVLPLMQESGLEEIFNKKCGDLQFLDKNNTDISAISYDEKLQKYLETVLIGDELAEKIRAAFDAYVFLSYRKKDRKYAQEIMHLIHKNEFCRDIAIWYDEFLTPGENFNDSIKEALLKSGLFVLTVTPNLVNEPNYIMTTEYPMAKQNGKPILPAELVPTDRKQLSEKYEDIPKPADAYNEAELTEALLESVKKMDIKENNSSPEHTFFIGLAYLGGIDVEVDHERATQLITMAAENNFPKAMEQLFKMYLKGNGVIKNFEQAIFWGRRLMNYWINQFEPKMPRDEFNNICSELYGISKLLCVCPKDFRKLCYEYTDTILHISEKYFSMNGGDIYHPIIDAYRDKSYFYEKVNDIENAISVYEKIINLYQAKYEENCKKVDKMDKVQKIWFYVIFLPEVCSEYNKLVTLYNKSEKKERYYIIEKYIRELLQMNIDIINYQVSLKINNNKRNDTISREESNLLFAYVMGANNYLKLLEIEKDNSYLLYALLYYQMAELVEYRNSLPNDKNIKRCISILRSKCVKFIDTSFKQKEVVDAEYIEKIFVTSEKASPNTDPENELLKLRCAYVMMSKIIKVMDLKFFKLLYGTKSLSPENIEKCKYWSSAIEKSFSLLTKQGIHYPEIYEKVLLAEFARFFIYKDSVKERAIIINNIERLLNDIESIKISKSIKTYNKIIMRSMLDLL